MKNLIIIIVIIVLLASTGIYVASIVKKNKQQQDDDDDWKPEPAPLPRPNTTPNSNSAIVFVQKQINSLLPESQKKLVIDGIWGNKSQKALDFLNDWEELPFFHQPLLVTINSMVDTIL